ncbi:hypothetical protein Tcan_09514 [Toxocara canis]|uniref:Uncharacterized protein n=1 Tax=Toxocara canis TaxID=6265 RepID=A0A0B2VRE0_TOXCA|nr:hypothetical protein Tcan_09514 [Toxocara canis]
MIVRIWSPLMQRNDEHNAERPQTALGLPNDVTPEKLDRVGTLFEWAISDDYENCENRDGDMF